MPCLHPETGDIFVTEIPGGNAEKAATDIMKGADLGLDGYLEAALPTVDAAGNPWS